MKLNTVKGKSLSSDKCLSKPRKKSLYLNFDQEVYRWKQDVDYRRHPESYLVGKGEQGVLIWEPYKSEIGQFWRFRTKTIAEERSDKIYGLFLDYLQKGDFSFWRIS